ncbi:hypothetical protein [Nonomuraea diastatica]|uniref:Uncharacterized protein n=1 Tax=Nonomuraea diastatica TaxID=1848329 RepID=A0A4R4X4R6_9ACTN|nr:hypothetical protein [Nonomuraea diastatica]TDD25331.1 hypothetical protein E1294_03385 [Nonomuraea diastatica]
MYVLSVRGGDVSFIARHLPDGWFSLASGPATQALAASFPLPGLLAAAVLGALVLVVYDTALLYNLGHLGAQVIPGAVVLIAVRYGARSFP